ncbi:hypothetical protein HHI36_000128 [Cryptolaemus montrouzieri]|uniref:Clip domain-containing protein n=1 Tax=Cryptolaemus montrouzieri TaxID=559131 RepID=A0ABD2P3V1_9CUCU
MKCTGIKSCPTYMNFIKTQSKPLQPQMVKFLKEKQCGFETGFPKVCCGDIPTSLKAKTSNAGQKIKKNNLSVIHNDSKTEIIAKKHPKELTHVLPSLNYPNFFLGDILEPFDLFRRKRESEITDNSLEVEIR